jgi:hypothetical protein
LDIPADVTIEFSPLSSRHIALFDVKRYWDKRRGARRMPARHDIEPNEIRSWLSQILLVDVLADASDFRYRLIGTRLDPYFPTAATGLRFTEALAPFGEPTVLGTLAVYRQIVQERAPALIKGPGHYLPKGPSSLRRC